MQLEHIKKTTGKTPKALTEAVALPEGLAYLWGYFMEWNTLDVSWSELRAWADCTGRTLQPWEFSALMKLAKIRDEPTHPTSNSKT